ncbi:MAG: transglutaminase family protein [Hespellia sp.]|nr:transglutaminase family protein [Hespellia sp.]
MKNLRFTYEMSLRFDEPIYDHYFALRCVPVSDDVQKIQILSRYINPTDCLNEVVDGFGNHKYVGHYFDNHKQFEVQIVGNAAVEGMKVHREVLHSMYKYPSRFTEPGQALKAAAEACSKVCGNPLERAVQLMMYLYQHFTYVKGSTDISTTAEEAMKAGRGVCQDYAHILIALCRMSGIAARYVNGFMIGEGSTHAWVEIYTGEGWYGLDPTNNLHIDDYYIKLAHGRDYADCVLDKGVFMGSPANQKQQILVNVEEI